MLLIIASGSNLSVTQISHFLIYLSGYTCEFNIQVNLIKVKLINFFLLFKQLFKKQPSLERDSISVPVGWLTGVQGIVCHERQMSQRSEGLHCITFGIFFRRSSNLQWTDPIWTDSSLVPLSLATVLPKRKNSPGLPSHSPLETYIFTHFVLLMNLVPPHITPSLACDQRRQPLL